MKNVVSIYLAACAACALLSCSQTTPHATPAQEATTAERAKPAEAAHPGSGGSQQAAATAQPAAAALPGASWSRTLKLATLAAGETLDATESSFAAGVSSDAFSWVALLRSGNGPGRIVTSDGEITNIDELLVMYPDLPVPAGRYRQGGSEYVFIGKQRAGPYELMPYYEAWDDAMQALPGGSRWAYWYQKGDAYWIASSTGSDLGPYSRRPSFTLRPGFFVAQLPDGSWWVDGEPAHASDLSTTGDMLAYTVKEADGMYVVPLGGARMGPYTSLEHLTTSEDGWAVVAGGTDGNARLLSSFGESAALPAGDVESLVPHGKHAWGAVLHRGTSYVLYSPRDGESEPVESRECHFFSDPETHHTVVRFKVQGVHQSFVRELGTDFGPYKYCKLNDWVMDPLVVENGWVTPVVEVGNKFGYAYNYRGTLTVIPGGECEEGPIPLVTEDGMDVAFPAPTPGGTTTVWWRGVATGNYGSVRSIMLRRGELLVSGTDTHLNPVVTRNGERWLSHEKEGAYILSQDGRSALYFGIDGDSARLSVDGQIIGGGIVLKAGETMVKDRACWYWITQDGNDIVLHLRSET